MNWAGKNIYPAFLTEVLGGLIETTFMERHCKQESIILKRGILIWSALWSSTLALHPPCAEITPQLLGLGKGVAWVGYRKQPSRSLPMPAASQEHCARCRGAGSTTVAWPISALNLFQPFNRDNEQQEIHQSHISPVILTPFNKSDDT